MFWTCSKREMFPEKTNRPCIHVEITLEITLEIESWDPCLHGLS